MERKNMKLLQIATLSTRHLLLLSLTTVTVVSVNSLFAPSSQAGSATSFVCDKSEGELATVAKTKTGDVPIVIWSSTAFEGFTPQVRCKQVSARFQSLYSSGQLKYITAGTLNQRPVVCATKKISSVCTNQNLLYTLKPNSDPKQVIERLKAIRNQARTRPVEESGTPTANDSIDLNWLE
jgi:Circadian oscillating protein COP23